MVFPRSIVTLWAGFRWLAAMGKRDRSSEIRCIRSSSIVMGGSNGRGEEMCTSTERMEGGGRGQCACSGLFCIIRLHNGILMNATVLLVCPETFYGAENYNIGLNYHHWGWSLTLFKNRLRIWTGRCKIIPTIISVNRICFSNLI